jgi:murein DD-endopeptidase MepM/ murein hydrolase activator NlpD
MTARRSPSLRKTFSLLCLLLMATSLLVACQSSPAAVPLLGSQPGSNRQSDDDAASIQQQAEDIPGLFSNRPRYAPGELVDYTAQTGDTLAGLAARFNTTVAEIRQANTFIPDSATTMPPGMPMKIPIYYLPLWGSDYHILPDSHYVNSPIQAGFDTAQFIAAHPGWISTYREYADGADRSAAEIVNLVALKFSLSPRLLLALLEYQSGALTDPDPAPEQRIYPLDYRDRRREGLYRQLLWAANLLNDGYYAWRTAELTSLELSDGRQVRFDPWQNAATVGLHQFFDTFMQVDDFARATSPEGFARTYTALFGDPWQSDAPHIPGSLEQPDLLLPFEPGLLWAYTGGPHTAWGNARPYSALDFAPPLSASGCQETDEWAIAIADGVVARVDVGEVVLDLDGDGNENTGWAIFYLHLASEGRAPLGATLKAGDRIGHPSCEGGSSTGTHVHIARKYNGEWIPAAGFSGGVLAFNLEGWVAQRGAAAYQGTLTRLNQVVTACECSNRASFIERNAP